MSDTLIVTAEAASLNPMQGKAMGNFTLEDLRELVRRTDLPVPVTLNFDRTKVVGTVESMNLNSQGLLKVALHLVKDEVENLNLSVYAAVGCSVYPEFKLYEIALVSEHSDPTIKPINWEVNL